jgi:hypothetical protein
MLGFFYAFNADGNFACGFGGSTMKLILTALLIFFCTTSHALERGTLRVAALAGQVGLFGDPGANGSNALGLAGSVGFQISDMLALELRYLASNHSEVNHRDLSVGAEYAIGDFETGYPHLSAGMSFLSNEFPNASISASAAGIYVGGGLDFELARHLQIGPDVRYVKSFESHGRVSGIDRMTIGDDYSVMIRLSYLIGLND